MFLELEKADAPSDGTRVDDACSTKRRHARPVELDSEGEEEEDEEEEETGKEESSVSEQEDEANVEVSETMSSSKVRIFRLFRNMTKMNCTRFQSYAPPLQKYRNNNSNVFALH